ncbi:MAG: hypothetical protein PHE48_02835 [Candidatus Daviesbacteria bacterium]|nr:hypothetical protein [Candidatus Daviesbacteria bacterium]
MENNNPVQAPITPNVASPAPVSKPETPPQAQMPGIPPVSAPSNNSNNIVVWFVVGLIIVILAVGGIYFFLNRQQATTPQTQTTTTQTSPSPQPNLEDELNSINVPLEADADFIQVDQDLQQL